MTTPDSARDPAADCDDTPKLTAEEWEAIAALSADEGDASAVGD